MIKTIDFLETKGKIVLKNYKILFVLDAARIFTDTFWVEKDRQAFLKKGCLLDEVYLEDIDLVSLKIKFKPLISSILTVAMPFF